MNQNKRTVRYDLQIILRREKLDHNDMAKLIKNAV